ncbi:MAG: 5-(carboxyamino)imidazole ribonucleotide synthase [Bacteroidetes bacterium]|nr:5-(carboxyamino)imidazole ribonucleotide synthase [Bacteroidota bacterium]
MYTKTIGILGGGQLGKMLLQKAADYNLKTIVMDGTHDAPCRHLCTHFMQGSLTDYETVLNFGEQCDVITIEIENVNTEALIELEKMGKVIYPQPHLIKLIQDKGLQKNFYRNNNIATAPFYLVEKKMEINSPYPFIQKLRTGGYDGRGVQKIDSPTDLDKNGFEEPSVIEELIDFEKEIAVIAVRNHDGEIAVYDAVEMHFDQRANLLDYLFAPASLTLNQAAEAKNLAKQVVEHLGIIGILAVEMFVTKKGEILVNEIAPRPHNSGHHSIEANASSQYDQLLRILMHQPLGSTEMIQHAVMFNLLGEQGYQGQAQYKGMEQLMSQKNCHVHLYGKSTTKPFRKMGHVTVTGNNVEQLIVLVNTLKKLVHVIAAQ